jgi:hypothetical protein
MEWLTTLSLFDVNLSRHDWSRLSNLHSLVCLYIHNSRPKTGSIDNVVVKGWAIAARDDGAFPVLQLMVLVNQDQLSLGILEYLVEFPSLRALHLTGPHLSDKFIEDAIAHTRWKYLRE